MWIPLRHMKYQGKLVSDCAADRMDYTPGSSEFIRSMLFVLGLPVGWEQDASRRSCAPIEGGFAKLAA